MNLLSIQSHVVYGHVGNSAAVLPLQRLGHEVWPIHTVQFSNHTGYGGFRGRVFDAEMIHAAILGLEERGVLQGCDGVLSGYLGSAEIGEAILDAVARVKRHNPKALYCCDPVIGNAARGMFVRPGIAELLRDRALAHADIVTPNQFELAHLSAASTSTLAEVRAAVDAVHARGPGVVLVTSLRLPETPADAIDVLVSDAHGRWRLRTPLLPIAADGAGDAVAALFFGHVLAGLAAGEAMSLSVSSLFGVLERTRQAGSREMALVAAQDEFVAPSRIFEAKPF